VGGELHSASSKSRQKTASMPFHLTPNLGGFHCSFECVQWMLSGYSCWGPFFCYGYILSFWYSRPFFISFPEGIFKTLKIAHLLYRVKKQWDGLRFQANNRVRRSQSLWQSDGQIVVRGQKAPNDQLSEKEFLTYSTAFLKIRMPSPCSDTIDFP
jgi:hypothetical protein